MEEEQSLALSTSKVHASASNMMVFDATLRSGVKLRALLDTGASENFIREAMVKKLGLSQFVRFSNKSLVIRLATGAKRTFKRATLQLDVSLQGFRSVETFLVLDMDDKYDIILDMPWFTWHKPQIDWDNGILLKQEQPRVCSDVTRTSQTPRTVSSSIAESDGADNTDIGKCHDAVHQSSVQDAVAISDRIDHGVNQFRKIDVLSKNRTAQSRGKRKVRFNPNVSFASDSTKNSTKTKSGRRNRCTIQNGILKIPDISHKGDVSTNPSGTREVNNRFRETSVTQLSNEGLINLLEVLESPPMRTEDICSLQLEEYDEFLKDLKLGQVEQICYISPQSIENDDSQDVVSLRSSSVQDEAVLNEKTKIQRFESQGWSSLKNSPFYELLKEFEDVFPDEVPAELPVDKGVRHEIDLVPGTKYCVTRQWPLPKEQVEVIDDFFAQRAKAGQVRESKSPHCSPTFCVKKATGGWRIVHAFNKLNSATVPAQTPIPRKDVILDSMQGSTIFSTIDLRDGYYQILMREKDIPLTAVSTPSGMLWEWLVMPQGLSNAPATFNRCVSQLFRSCRNFAPCYFDDIFIHSKSEANLSEVQVHTGHLREVLSVMRKYKLYANIKKCIFGAPEIPVLGCFVGRNGVRADPEKIKAIVDWPVPQNVKELRQWLGIANYLHKYTKNYADIVRPLSALLRKDEAWIWTPERGPNPSFILKRCF